MKPYYQDNSITVYNKPCNIMDELQDESVQMVVTSPPYWGLRKYAGNQDLIWPDEWRGGYGLEPTPEMYVSHSIEIIREIRRVLRKDGVVFWNVDDSYSNLKPKDLCLIPFRFVIAAQEDGWYIRSVIIWNKPNPMPESVKDRPTGSHEYIFLLTKSDRYYWNQEAILEPCITTKDDKSGHKFGGSKCNEANSLECHSNQPGKKWIPRKMQDADKGVGGSGSGFKGHSGNYDANGNLLGNPLGRNVRSVWTFPTHPYKEAHFATFPEELPERCIKAGSKEGDIILEPFAGSGTTLWVSKRLNRKAIGYEISEEYCELIVNRNRQLAMC